MNEYDDFFDEMIDDEAEWDEPEDESSEEDSSAKMRTILLLKNDMIAVLGLKTSAQSGRIVRSDPRQNLPTAQMYDDPAAAAMWFKRSLSTSVKNGWSIIYDGQPLRG